MSNGELTKYIAPADLFVQLQTKPNEGKVEEDEKWLVQRLYKDLKITPAQAEDFKGHMQGLKHGLSAAVPLICTKRCPFTNVCRAKFAGIEPLLNKPCMVELNLIQYYRRLYLETFNVESGDFGSFILINELAELDLYDFRATLVLALGDTATGSTPIDDSRPNIGQALLTEVEHIDKMGNITITQEINSAFKLKESLKNRKLKILDLLVATRKEQYKKEAALGEGKSNKFAEEQRKIMQRIEAMEQSTIEASKIETSYYEKVIEDM